MKKIQRPDSTTVVDEIRFHVIKNKEELLNITERSDKNSLFGYKSGVDETTFQPTFWFMIKDKDTDTDIKSWEVWGNYIVTLELIIETGLQNYFEKYNMIKGLS